jgi:hypothetical protein
MSDIKFWILIISVLISNRIYSANPRPETKNFKSDEWGFVENKGQIRNKNGAPFKELKYYSHASGASIFCLPGKISFAFSKKEDPEPIAAIQYKPVKYNLTKWYKPSTLVSKIEMILVGSNPNAQIIADDIQQYYENFYLPGCGKNGIKNIHSFKTITYKNIYQNIDLVLHAGLNHSNMPEQGLPSFSATKKGCGIEYEFVIYQGGNVNDIQIKWEGPDSIIKNPDGCISYKFPSGSLKEYAPFSYQKSESEIPEFNATAIQMIKVESSFSVINNTIHYNIADYDKNKILIIDPVLSWGSYFGGAGNENENGCGITTDSSGNVIITGGTTSISDIVSSGSFQTINGDADAFIAKFSPEGIRLWSTYFGGNSNDGATGIANDRSGNIFITGSTRSDSDLASTGAFQTSYGGGEAHSGLGDAFLAKFNPSGQRIWSTYFGGEDDDYGTSISTDKWGNVIATGYTKSIRSIASAGTFQTSLKGQAAAFIVKMATNGSLLWSTYFGGNIGETGTGICTDLIGNIFITGSSASDSGIATSGAYQTYNAGFSNHNGNAYVAKFSPSGNRIWSTYFGGSGTNMCQGIAADYSGNIYITGNTESVAGIATSGTFQTSLINGYGAFIAKFSNNGSRLWGTYFGQGNISSQGIKSDAEGRIYVTGYTFSDSGIASPGAYQTTKTGLFDAFIAQFNSKGNRIWSSYYGGKGYDYGLAITTDKMDNAILTGYTNSSDGIATSGSFHSKYYGSDDAFVVKFDFKSQHDAGVPYLYSLINIICPGNQNVIIGLKNFGKKSLNSVTVSWSVNGKIQNPLFWSGNLAPDSIQKVNLGNYQFIAGGTDTIMAWTSMPNGFIDSVPENDTIMKILNVYNVRFAGIGAGTYNICRGTHIKIGANAIAGNTYSWSSNPPGFTSVIADPVVNPASAIHYYLTETNIKTSCTNYDSTAVKVNIRKAPIADAGSDRAICPGDSSEIGSATVAGLGYSWSSNPVGISSALAELFVKPDSTTSYTLMVKDAYGCTDLDSVTVTVNKKPKAITGADDTVCSGTVIQLGSAPLAGHTYTWTSVPSGFISSVSNPKVIADISRTYYLTETITSTGCKDSNHLKVLVTLRPFVKIHKDSLDAFSWKFIAVSPNYPPLVYKWSIHDSVIATGDSIIYTFKQNGSYVIKLTVAFLGLCTETDSVLIDIHPAFSLNIFPNPFSLHSSIRYVLPKTSHIKIVITDVIGREITTIQDRVLDAGEYYTPIKADALNTRPGIYIVIFMMDNLVITRKIVQLDSVYY